MTTHKIIISTIDGDTLVELNNKQFQQLHDRLTDYYNQNYELITEEQEDD